MKIVELLCALMTIVASAPLYAQTAKIDVSQGLENLRRQEAISVIAEQKGIFKAPPEKNLTTSSKALGGPGLDGGGGVGIMTSQGQLRFLDLAIVDRNTLVNFDNETYARILSRKGNFISNKGTYVSNAEFFSCADQKLQRQANILLQFLKPANLRLTVALTDLPLNNGSLRLSKIVFPSPAGTGYAWEVTQLPVSNLFSQSVPKNYQRPIASYAVQPTIQGATSQQVLLVSAQMYHALPPRDQCALQIHELLRYMNNLGRLGAQGTPLFVKRQLSTKEIERLTYKIMIEYPVYLGEIPATSFYKFLAVNGSDHFDDGVFEQIASTLRLKDENYPLSVVEAATLYSYYEGSTSLQVLHEESMMRIGKNNTRFREILHEQEKKLEGKRYRISDIVF